MASEGLVIGHLSFVSDSPFGIRHSSLHFWSHHVSQIRTTRPGRDWSGVCHLHGDFGQQESAGRGAGEVAHLKLIGMDDAGAFAVGNVVSNDTAAKLSLPSNITPREADLIVNARVAIDPAVLEAEVRKVVAAECGKIGVNAEFRTAQSLRPGRPVPTHRYAAAKG